MKKIFVITALLLVFGLSFAGAQIWETNAPANYRVNIPKNEWNPGFQTAINPAWLFNGNQLKEGEKYELEVTFTSNRAIPELKIMLIDGTEKANWWKELSIKNASDEWPAIKNIQVNTPVTAKFTFEIFHTATNASRDANKLILDYLEPSQAATLTFSQFTFRRIQ